MAFRRVVAVVLCLILIALPTACTSAQTTSSNADQVFSDVNNSYIDNTATSSDQQIDNQNQDISSQVSDSQDTNIDTGSNQTSSDIISNDNQDVVSNTPSDNTVVLKCNHDDSDPYQGVSKVDFYADYSIACCNIDASNRSKHGLLSGSLEVPGQYAVDADNRPRLGDKFIRNTSTLYLDDGNTYVIMDANGDEVIRIHKAGGYITLEEVAAYMYAFGGNDVIPANYTSKKKGNPTTSIWGEYLRVNHSYFLGDTDKYPYEPELPNISGCGGQLRYYEMDIGTTGTVTPGYAAKPYIQGSKINRGAARIVYTRYDLNHNGIYENNEVYVFYTHNHYNDFREYLNYYGGWGEMFGNVTGGGEYSSETKANPTPYVTTDYANFYN